MNRDQVLDVLCSHSDVEAQADAIVALDATSSALVTVLTNAPQAYDYGYTTQVGAVHVYPNDLRVVTMPWFRHDYQCGRYLSGSYIVANVVTNP